MIAGTADGTERLPADIILIATGTTPRELPTAQPDGERILTWTQLYNLRELPERLIVVGSGVTGAEFASASTTPWAPADVVLVSSRHQVLPGEDDDAARVVQQAFERSGMTILFKSRAQAARVVGDEVVVELADGRTVTGSHCLMAVGSIPNTSGLGLAEAGCPLQRRGLRDRRQGVARHRPWRLRRRRLHRGVRAGVGGGDAGPDRHGTRGATPSARSTCARWPPMCSPHPRSPRSG